MLEIITLLLTAFLFGGTVLFSFAFAAFLFTHLPPAEAGKLLRSAFPHFYLWCMLTSGIAAIPFYWVNPIGTYLLFMVAATTLPARQILMPAINAATDRDDQRRFKQLHGLSVAVTLGHIAAVGYALTLLI
ncbi:MAG: DUF4149 domain-containing protein [Halieaceae bacterium]|jgi:hypothetical protein|nr:DUF4149 domain-containing protein [Halieaceae bacterium]